MQSAISDINVTGLRLGAHRPRRKLARRFFKRSSVAIILDQRAGKGVCMLMIRRAQRAGDPWSGHMGFPGGRRESDDAHSLHTATRETMEEIGFDCDTDAELIGRLSDLAARPNLWQRSMVVTPWVFRMRGNTELRLNHEVDETVWVPLAYLGDPRNRTTMPVTWKGITRDFDCYHFGPYTIWGLSLAMIDELMATLS